MSANIWPLDKNRKVCYTGYVSKKLFICSFTTEEVVTTKKQWLLPYPPFLPFLKLSCSEIRQGDKKTKTKTSWLFGTMRPSCYEERVEKLAQADCAIIASFAWPNLDDAIVSVARQLMDFQSKKSQIVANGQKDKAS